MTILAIVQARMSSSRLPGKVLEDLGGQPMLSRVLERVFAATRLDGVVVATSTNRADDAIEAFCQSAEILVFRGSEDDVLDRYVGAARAHGADAVARLTADCPLLDPTVIDRVVARFAQGDADYVSNTIERTYPDGLDVEVFSRKVLELAWREARWASEREHVTPFIWKQPDRFAIRQVTHTENLSGLRWTVDDRRDLELARSLYGRLAPAAYRMSDVLAVLAAEPGLAGINAGTETNEGYRRSVERDRMVDR